MVMTGLDLPASLYTTSVAATGSMYIRSNKVYTNITVNTTNPAVKGTYNFFHPVYFQISGVLFY